MSAQISLDSDVFACNAQAPMTMTPALAFLSRYFQSEDVRPLAFEVSGPFRADVFLVNVELAEGLKQPMPYTVLSQARGSFADHHPVLATELPHIPFAESQRGSAQMDNSIGVFIQVEEIFEPGASMARFTRAPDFERVISITENRAVLFNWNSPWLPLRAQAHVAELLIGETWRPTVAPTIGATPETFATAWAEDQRGATDYLWAADALETLSFDDTLTLIRSLVVNLDANDPTFRIFAEGPLQNLLRDPVSGASLCAFIEQDHSLRSRWIEALRFVRLRPVSPALAERISALFGPPNLFQGAPNYEPTLER